MSTEQQYTYQKQVQRLEAWAPILLAIHGGIMLGILGGTPITWTLVLLAAALGSLSFTNLPGRLNTTLFRAVGLFVSGTVLIYLTGGTNSFFLLWYFVIVAIYPFILNRPFNTIIPYVIPVQYFSMMILVSHEALPPVVVGARSFLLLFIGLFNQRLGKILHDYITERDALIRNASDGIFISDLDGNFIDVNESGSLMLGHSREEILQMNIRDLVVHESNPIPLKLDELKKGMVVLSERNLRHKNGHVIPLEINSKMIDGNKLQGIARDITERKRAEAERVLLDKIRTAVANELDLSKSLQRVVESIVDLFGYSHVSVYLLNGETLFLQHQVGYSQVINEIPVMQGVAGRAARNGQPIFIRNVQDDPSIFDAIDGIISKICIPIYDQGKVAGILIIESGEIDGLTESDLKLMTALGETISPAIGRARLYTQLLESEGHYRTLAETATDAIITINHESIILFANQAIEKVFGYDVDELLGRNLTMLMPQNLRDAHKNSLSQYLVTGIKHIGWNAVELRGLHKNGKEIPLEISFGDHVSDGQHFFTGIMRDISGRKQAEATLQRHHDYLTALQKITLELLDRTDVKSLLLTICEKAASLLDAKHAFIFLDDGDTLLLRATSRDLTHHLDEREKKPGAGVLGQVWQTGQPVKVEHYETWELRDPNYAGDRLQSVTGVPILQGETMIGVLVVARVEEDNRIFSDEEMDILSRFAELASLVLDNVSLYESALNEIAERQKIEAALTKSEERYRILFEESPISIWEEDFSIAKRYLSALQEQGIIDIRDYLDANPDEISNIAGMVNVVDVNQASLRMYRARDKEVLFKNLQQTLLPEVLQNFKEELIAIAENKPSISWDGRDMKTDGELMDVNVSWTVAPESIDSYSRVIVSIIDITERKRAEQIISQHAAELERRVEERTIELVHANRTKDEFLANMSHELRTPLNSILGFSETLLEQRRGPLNKKQEQYVDLIHSSGQHLLGLINDILEVSKIEAGKLDLRPDIVSVKEVCDSSLNIIREMAIKKSISIEYRNEQSIHALHADPQRLKQILVNLLNNAVKFTPQNGKVSLEVNLNDDKDRISFSVIDNGIGIVPENLPKLFTPFTQLDSSLSRQYEGTGLGLVLVLKFTELHGGSVRVESEPNVGSRFTIILPWSENDLREQEGFSKTAHSLKAVKNRDDYSDYPGKILLVEDNEASVLTIQEYLSDHGYDVDVAHDGAEAITMAEVSSPDLILMDIQMPKMDGLEAIRRLRAAPKSAFVPIIAVTALAMPGDRERCFEAGANEYMSKPVSLKTLQKTIKRFLRNDVKKSL